MTKIQSKFEVFKRQYQDKYAPEAWKYIEENFFDGLKDKEAPDILMQIYTELGIRPVGGFFYQKHLKLLKDLFPIDGHIIEVGSGRIPAFANLLANEQLKIGKGTITIYEPLLVQLTPRYPNMELHKEDFTLETDVSKSDLLVGIMACEATESILESAIKNNKDFYVAMCGCVHSPLSYMSYYGYYTSPEIYQEQVITKAERLLKDYPNGTLEVTKLEDTPFDYPILYNKKR